MMLFPRLRSLCGFIRRQGKAPARFGQYGLSTTSTLVSPARTCQIEYGQLAGASETALLTEKAETALGLFRPIRLTR